MIRGSEGWEINFLKSWLTLLGRLTTGGGPMVGIIAAGPRGEEPDEDESDETSLIGEGVWKEAMRLAMGGDVRETSPTGRLNRSAMLALIFSSFSQCDSKKSVVSVRWLEWKKMQSKLLNKERWMEWLPLRDLSKEIRFFDLYKPKIKGGKKKRKKNTS